MCNGWVVAQTDTDEVFDIVARDPVSREWATFQVKSVKLREDRRGELVIQARKGNGEVYAQSDADYVIGVLESEDGPRVWMLPNRSIGEYWASSERRADVRWHKLPLTLDRGYYTESTPAGPVDVAL